VLSLLLTGTSFSMQAYIGIIMLAGIVVSNAILLVDYINTLRRATACRCARRWSSAAARACARF
jgi:multidrug efflux pump subunit AcrB